MAAAEVQTLLRFLTQDAKLPLADAIAKITTLREHQLTTPIVIAKADFDLLKTIFHDEKATKQVQNAAKRISNPKKRTASQADLSQVKRRMTRGVDAPRDIESELALPTTDASDEDLYAIRIETNRAPLVLAFAIIVQEFTRPEQPLSSRLSLAQAVVSANSVTKAKSIGLLTGDTAEEEGWAKGQPMLKILSREIPVMRRQTLREVPDIDSQETVTEETIPTYEAYWGLDVEALRKSNGPLVVGRLAGSQGPPIHTPQAARSYLLKSISLAESADDNPVQNESSKKKKSAADNMARKERATAFLLESIRLLCKSWASTLTTEELDRRAWSWYISVRPEVLQGQHGWGQRGIVALTDILRLRRTP